MTQPRRIKKLDLHTTQGDAGALLRESQFVVRYNDEALKRPELALSLTMPPRAEGYRSNQLTPVLAMTLPEGFLLDRVVTKYRKTMDIEDMNLLAITSTPSAGRVWASLPEGREETATGPVALSEILASPGTEKLFDELLERFAQNSSIAGVQPKVVVPAEQRQSEEIIEKSAIKAPDLIVKSAGVEYEGLAENEFICMSIAKHVGLETPDFWLSEGRNLFVIRRFDMGSSGYLGFEDLAALTGKHPTQKYESSYGVVAKAIADFVAPTKRASSLEAFFRQLVLSCVIRNGDAHLKNFGILYGDPATASRDARLSPVYDLICSTIYLPNDALALSIAGSKAWPDRKVLERFGRNGCEIHSPSRIIDEIEEKAMSYRPVDANSGVWNKIRLEIEKGAETLATRRITAIS